MYNEALSEIKNRRNAVRDIAEACSVSTQAVSQWRRVPKKHVELVASLTGKLPAELRPDLFVNSQGKTA